MKLLWIAVCFCILHLKGEAALSPLIENYLRGSQSIQSYDSINLPEFRKNFRENQKSVNQKAPRFNLQIKDEDYLLADGKKVAVRSYINFLKADEPLLIFLHGGGFVFGDLETIDIFCREIAHFSKCTVFSIEYPLAPESPYPIAIDTIYQTLLAIYKDLPRRKIQSDRVFIGGSSAGATLAAAIALMARDRNGPALKGQILLCPMMDTSFNTVSHKENATGYNLTTDHCRWFYSKYCKDFLSRKDPYLAPLHATDFKGLPRALVVTAEFDPLRDEGRVYAEKLEEAKVPSLDLCYKGMIHGFFTLPLDLDEKWHVLKQIGMFIDE